MTEKNGLGVYVGAFVVIHLSKDARWVVVHRNCRALAVLKVVAP